MNTDIPLPATAYLSRPWLAGRNPGEQQFAVVEVTLTKRTPGGWRFIVPGELWDHFLQDRTGDTKIFAKRADAEDWVTARLQSRVDHAQETLVTRRLDLAAWKQSIATKGEA